MSWQRIVVRHSGRWDRLEYVDGEDQLLYLSMSELSRDMLVSEIHEFMDTSPNNVTYSLSYLTSGVGGRPTKVLVKANVDFARLIQEQDVPIVYVTQKIIQEAPPTVSNEYNDDPLEDDFINEPSTQNSEDEDEDYEKELRHNQIVEFCEWIREPGHIDEFVKILEHGGPHNFSDQTVSNVPAPNVHGPSTRNWLIPVAHVGDALAVVQDGPVEVNTEALKVGSMFLKKDDLIIVVGKWHMQREVEYSVSRSSKTRLDFLCKQKDICPFRIYATAKDGVWRVQICEDKHTCQLDLSRDAPRKLSSKVIAHFFSKKLLYKNAILKPKKMIAELLMEYGIEVQYNVALRARNLALEMVYGNSDESFQMLPTYLHMLKTSNPGTVYDMQTSSENRFKFMFLALGVSRVAFSHCMRPVVVVDGTHLKGKNKGILFVDVTKDGNEQCFPLAIGVGPIENDVSWTWFLSRFKQAFGEREDMLIVSDQHPSIKNAISIVYPNVAHGLCYHHLVKNLARYGTHLISLFQVAAYTYRDETFQKYFSLIQGQGHGNAYNHLMKIGVHRWTRSQCPVRRYSFMTSNIAESFNSCLLWARRLPICSLIEVVRNLIEKWFDKRRELALSRDHALTVESLKKLSGQVKISHHRYSVCHTIAHCYTVKNEAKKSFSVDLEKKTCDCREFQDDQIPCSHAAAAIRSIGLNQYDYVEFYYKMTNLRLSYHDRVCPVSHRDDWIMPSGQSFMVIPPISVSQAGRPKQGRHRSSFEGSSSRRPQKCSRCGCPGHNKSNCKTPLV